MLTTYANDLVLNHIFNGPDRRFVGLSHASANKSGFVIEPEGNYERVEIEGAFGEVEFGRLTNDATHLFPLPDSDWGLIRSVFIIDGDDNVLAMANLKVPKYVGRGKEVRLSPSSIVLSHF